MEAWGGQNRAGCVVAVLAEAAGDGDSEDEDDGDAEELKVVEIRPLARYWGNEEEGDEAKKGGFSCVGKRRSRWVSMVIRGF